MQRFQSVEFKVRTYGLGHVPDIQAITNISADDRSQGAADAQSPPAPFGVDGPRVEGLELVLPTLWCPSLCRPERQQCSSR